MPITNGRRVYVVRDHGPWTPAFVLVVLLFLAVAIANGDISLPASPDGRAPRPVGTTAVVRPAEGLDLRVLPDPEGGRAGHLPAGAEVELICHTTGPEAAGGAGTPVTWDRVRAGGAVGFVADRDLRTDGEVTDLVDPC